MKCLIQSGVFGTRLYPLITNKSKALLKYKGKLLLSHLVDKISRNIEIMISANHKHGFRCWQHGIYQDIDLCIGKIWAAFSPN